MAVAIRASATGTFGVTDLYVGNRPAGTADGDLLLAHVTWYDTSDTLNAPAGWTLVASTNATGANNTFIRTYWKIASSEPSTWTWSLVGAGKYGGVNVAAFTGASATDPIGNSTSNTGTTSTVTGSDVSATRDASMLVFLASGYNHGSTTTPTGMTAIDVNVDGVMSWWRQAVNAGATGTRSYTAAGADVWPAQMIIVQPAAGGASTLAADAGGLTLTGAAAGLTHGYGLAADVGALSLTGADAALSHGYTLVADAGALTLAGADAGLARGLRMAADVGALTAAGADAGLTAGRKLVADVAPLVLVGADAALVYSASHTLVADTASLTLTGGDAGLVRGVALSADVATLSLAAADAQLSFGGRLVAETAALSLAAADAALTYDAASATLVAETAALVLAGGSVAFDYGSIAPPTLEATAVVLLGPAGGDLEDVSADGASSASESRASGGALVEPHDPADPLEIFGLSRLAFWLRAEDFTPASWPDVTGNLTVVQADSGKQFVAAAGINGLPTALSDGTDDIMSGDMAVPLAEGSRPHILILTRTTLATSPPRSAFSLTSASAALTMLLVGRSSADLWRVSQTISALETVRYLGPTADASPHARELSWPDATTGHFFVDGAACDTVDLGTPTGAPLFAATGGVQIGAASAVAQFDNTHFRDLVCVRDQPTAAELIALRAWASYRLTHANYPVLEPVQLSATAPAGGSLRSV